MKVYTPRQIQDLHRRVAMQEKKNAVNPAEIVRNFLWWTILIGVIYILSMYLFK